MILDFKAQELTEQYFWEFSELSLPLYNYGLLDTCVSKLIFKSFLRRPTFFSSVSQKIEVYTVYFG